MSSRAPVAERAGLEAVVHAREELGELDVGRGAGHPQPFGVRGNDVGGVATSAYDAVHLLPGPEMLAQEPDRDLRDGEGVAGVDPPLGRGRGVGLVAGVVDREV